MAEGWTRLTAMARRLAVTLRHAGLFIPYFLLRAYRDDVARMASALSYTSLLALVPLLAIAVAMLTAFPVFDDVREQLQSLVFRYFVPHVGAAVQETVGRFVENTGQLTAIGVVGLAVTAVMLLVTIEGSLNAIFRVETARSPMSRLLVYWTALTLGPLLVGASFSLSGYFLAAQRWVEGEGLTGFTVLATALLPSLLIMLALALLYFAVPNREVRMTDAALGGVVAGLMFGLLRSGFGLYVANARTYQSVYGALSAIPIFLVWMYLSWLVVLVGAEFTAALPEWLTGRHDRAQPLPPKRRLALALDILAVLHAGALRGSSGTDRKVLLDHTTANEGAMLSVIERLRASGYVARAHGNRFILSRDLATVTLYDLVRCLDLGLDFEDPGGPETGWRRRAKDIVAKAAEREYDVLSLTLRDLFAEERGPRAIPQDADGRGRASA